MSHYLVFVRLLFSSYGQLKERLLHCRTANGFYSKGIVMAFYKFVLQSTEGPVFITTKDTLLLIKKEIGGIHSPI